MKIQAALLFTLMGSHLIAQEAPDIDDSTGSSLPSRYEGPEGLKAQPAFSGGDESLHTPQIGNGESPHIMLINDVESVPTHQNETDDATPPLTMDKDEPIASSEKGEKDPSVFIIGREKDSTPGGGVPRIGEKYLTPQPSSDLPWWERWWNVAKEWFGSFFSK